MLDHVQGRTDRQFADADTAWLKELAQRFGSDACHAFVERPEGRGEPGTRLRRAWEAREAAYRAWRHARALA